MRLDDIQTPVTDIDEIGDKTAHKLAHLGIYTVGGLLSHYPRDWDDCRKRVGLADARLAGPEGARVHTIVQVIRQSWFGPWDGGKGHQRNLSLRVSDGIDEGDVKYFYQPILAQIAKNYPVGAILAVTGTFTWGYNALQCTKVETKLLCRSGGTLAQYSAAPVPGSGVLPLYPLTAGVTQKEMRHYVGNALKKYGHGIDGDVPPAILTRRGFLPKQAALFSIHAPKTLEEAQLAKKSLIYEELYRFQVSVTKRAAERKGFAKKTEGAAPLFEEDLSPRQRILFASLPFELTADQKHVIAEINADIDRGTRERNALLVGLEEAQKTATPTIPQAWLSATNLEKARGKPLSQLIDLFGNTLVPIATLPRRYLAVFGDTNIAPTVFSGMAYFLDHAVNHHPELPVTEYALIQDVLDSPDDIRFDVKRKALICIKKYKNYGTLVIGVGHTPSMDKLHYVTYFCRSAKKKSRYDGLPSVSAKLSSAVDQPAISRAGNPAPAGDLSGPYDPVSIPPFSANVKGPQTEAFTGTEKSPPPYTMARLLQGDVGSGKTLAAFFAALRVADWGGQSALLAPTELLARQHADNAGRLLGTTGIRLAYLTGNVGSKERKPLLEAMAKGEVDLVIGTHALFSKQVRYKDLQLAIIDEQHRFGVLQRNAILEKGRTANFAPHLLMASATPIPRSLALTVFGDLDVSVIKTMPPGRLPVTTTRYPMSADMKSEQKVYDFVKKELDAGHQAYFVYPRIEELEKSEDPDVLPEKGADAPVLKSAEQMFPILSEKFFPGHLCALVHSKVDEDEQHRILEDFRTGKVRVLVATSVVEVGVDNPNATCMVIEHAERFGLAALHQLRGRVGRGTLPSFCFLVFKRPLKETGQARLEALHDTADGFAIAEEDLRLRGPGEMSGIQQSGYLTMGIADPIRDRELLEMAREDALTMLA